MSVNVIYYQLWYSLGGAEQGPPEGLVAGQGFPIQFRKSRVRLQHPVDSAALPRNQCALPAAVEFCHKHPHCMALSHSSALESSAEGCRLRLVRDPAYKSSRRWADGQKMMIIYMCLTKK